MTRAYQSSDRVAPPAAGVPPGWLGRIDDAHVTPQSTATTMAVPVMDVDLRAEGVRPCVFRRLPGVEPRSPALWPRPAPRYWSVCCPSRPTPASTAPRSPSPTRWH